MTQLRLTYGSMGTKSISTICSMCLSIEKMKVVAVEVLIKRIKYLRPYDLRIRFQHSSRSSALSSQGALTLWKTCWNILGLSTAQVDMLKLGSLLCCKSQSKKPWRFVNNDQAVIECARNSPLPFRITLVIFGLGPGWSSAAKSWKALL